MKTAVAIALLCVGCAPRVYTHGVLNPHQLELNVWRSGEPTAAGWDWLKAQHVCGVLQLDYDSERPSGVQPPDGILVFKFSMPPNDVDDVERGPTTAEVLDVVASAHSLLSTMAPGCVVLWHCKNGWDRTGLVSATWRRVVQHWTKEDAWAEAHRFGFHDVWRGLVHAWEGVP